MKYSGMTMNCFKEIKRLLELGLSVDQIARSVRCRKATVIDIRNGRLTEEELNRIKSQPPRNLHSIWMEQFNWEQIEEALKGEYELKRLWERYAQDKTSFSNFYRRPIRH